MLWDEMFTVKYKVLNQKYGILDREIGVYIAALSAALCE